MVPGRAIILRQARSTRKPGAQEALSARVALSRSDPSGSGLGSGISNFRNVESEIAWRPFKFAEQAPTLVGGSSPPPLLPSRLHPGLLGAIGGPNKGRVKHTPMPPAQHQLRSQPPVIDSISAIREAVTRARENGRSIALVPTMGALHAGHLSLIEAARRTGAYTVVSIYVNPTQFAPGEDLDAYPRSMETDHATCHAAGVDLIFAPSDTEMYPPGDQTRIRPGPLAEPLCGAFRPGHFEGVCTIVAKLLNIVQPDTAYFGQKDGQQALVIRRMVADLSMPVRIEVCPTVREPDGLALSSRNAYLSEKDRRRAVCLFGALSAGRDALLSGERSMERIGEAMRQQLTEIAGSDDPPITIDYLEIVDAESLTPANNLAGRLMLAGAIRLGETRLIDNLIVDLKGEKT